MSKWSGIDPVSFITTVLRDPETRRPFVLLPAEIAFLEHALETDDDGRLLHPELVYSAIKKSGKTAFAAIFLITLIVLLGGRYAEGFVVANDLEQAQSRVFEMVRRIIEASPLLRREAKITANKITFPSSGSSITALASNYESAAGAHPCIACFDELWGYTSERSRRLWDEMVSVPTRKISCRLTVTHAGFSAESQLLEELYNRGLAQPKVGTDLYAGDGLLMFWSHVPIAPWQDSRWLADTRRSLRPNQFSRMIENRFVSTDSSFIDLSTFDACVDPDQRPLLVDRALPVWCAIDASVKHDSTAIVAVAWDREQQKVRLVAHKIFQPSPERPIDFEGAVEHTLLTWQSQYQIRAALFDPFQMVAVAQRLTRAGIRMTEFPQTVSNLTEAAENLFTLVRGRNISLYADDQIRLAFSRAVAIESARGWRIGKEHQVHKIDVVVATAMAALACVRGQAKGRMRMALSSGDGCGPFVEVDPATLLPLAPRSHVVRGADGLVHLISDNTGRQGTD